MLPCTHLMLESSSSLKMPLCVMAPLHSRKCQNQQFMAYGSSRTNTTYRKHGISIHYAWQLHDDDELTIAAWSYCRLITLFERRLLYHVSVQDRSCQAVTLVARVAWELLHNAIHSTAKVCCSPGTALGMTAKVLWDAERCPGFPKRQ